MKINGLLTDLAESLPERKDDGNAAAVADTLSSLLFKSRISIHVY